MINRFLNLQKVKKYCYTVSFPFILKDECVSLIFAFESKLSTLILHLESEGCSTVVSLIFDFGFGFVNLCFLM